MSSATPPHDPGLYDLFVSYSTKDNQPPPGEKLGWVHAFILRLRDLAIPFTSQNISTTGDADAFPDWDTFYAPDAIQAGQLWEPRLRTAVAHSRVLLACLSPNYWRSAWCRIEWETYLENESARGLANQVGGITPIYFIEGPGVTSEDIIAQAPEWAKDLLGARQVRLLDFSEHGPDLLGRLAALRANPLAEARVKTIASRVAQQISHARRAERGLKGNLAIGTDTFVGRQEELRQVENQLFGAGALGVITALRGIGGQGKTALALRYGQNLRARYAGGCWQAGAEGAQELLPLIASLREPLGLPAVAAEDENAVARRVLSELHRRAHDPSFPRSPGHPAAVLLLLDNVDQPALLARPQREILEMALRQAGAGSHSGWLHLLATTRLEAHELSFLQPGQIIPVDALSEADALRLWLRISHPLGEAEIQAAREIIALVERHTLTVEIAARHIRRTPGETSLTYLARLRHALGAGPTRLARLLSGQQQAMQPRDLPGYAHPLAETLGFTFAHLAEEDPAAATILHYAAHWPAEAVPLPWLRLLAGQHHPELLSEPEAPGLTTAWDNARLRLGESLRLLTPADTEWPEIVRLHRLAGVFLRASAGQQGDEAARVEEVEDFIYARCGLAEHNPQAGLAPWERSVLLSDLTARMADKTCTNRMAIGGLLLGHILTAYADLATSRRLCQAAHSVLQRRADSDPANSKWQRDLSVSFNKLGDLAIAQGDLQAALRSFTDSKDIAQRLAASDPANAAWQRDLSVSFNKLGDLAVAQGDLLAASRFFSQALDIAKRLADRDPANSNWQRDLSVSYEKLGNLAVAQGDLLAASRFFSQALDIAKRLADSDPANSNWQRDLSVSLNKLGDLAVAQGDLQAASRFFSQDLDIAKRLADRDPANSQWQRDLWMSNGKLGDLATAHGDIPAALRFWVKANNITSRLAASDPANSAWQRDLSVSLNKLGDLAVAQGDLQAASRFFSKALDIAKHLADSDPANSEWQRDLSVSLNKLGDLAVAQGDLLAASRFFSQDLDIAKRLADRDPANSAWQRDLAVSHFKLFQLAQKSQDSIQAEAALRACYQVLRGMKERGVHMDSQATGLYMQLAELFGGT